MKGKSLFWVLVIIAVVFGLLSICMICHHSFISHGCSAEGGTSDVGTLITILGLLITFVVGFQIYNSLEAKETLKEIGELKNVKADLENFKCEIRAETCNLTGVIFENTDNYLLALCNHTKCLYYAIKCNDKHCANYSLSNATDIMNRWPEIKSKAILDSEKYEDDNKSIEESTIDYMNKITDELNGSKLYKEFEKSILDLKGALEKELKIGTKQVKDK